MIQALRPKSILRIWSKKLRQICQPPAVILRVGCALDCCAQKLLSIYFLPLISVSLVFSTTEAQTFAEISSQLGIDAYCVDRHIMGGGVAFFDYNQDYYPDIFIAGGESNNALYRNNWDGTFSNVSKLAGVELPGRNTYGIAVGDIDNDGDEDLFLTTGPNESNILLENQGDGTFQDISSEAGITEISWSTSATLGDVNLDGWVDIYVSNYAEFANYPFATNIDRCSPNFLYQNMGNNQFVNVASTIGVADIGCGLAVAFTDCDNDHDIDLHIANDFGGSFEPNELYLNAFPLQEFQQAPPSANVQVGINGMGIAIGDYDEDGDLDYYITNMGDNPFFENLDNGYFEDVAHQTGVPNPDGTSWGAAFLDFDQDTYLDLVVANGQVVASTLQNNENRLFQGSSSHVFQDVSQETGLAHSGACRGVSMADFDHDGDLDLMFGVVAPEANSESNTLLYRNDQSGEHNWLKLKLQGTSSHKNAYGSRIQVVSGSRSLIREADGGSSYLSHSNNEIHFGLGTAQSIDSLLITWPGGHQDVYLDIASNQQILVFENSHWLPYTHQELSIPKGDSILLASAFRREAGIYHQFRQGNNGQDSILLITRLKILPSAQQTFAFSLSPNPFQSETVISYSLQQSSQVSLSLYDSVGRLVEKLMETEQDAGEYSFSIDEHHFPAGIETSGICIFQLTINGTSYYQKGLNLTP